MSTVLVTGGLGVLGSWVTRQLVEQKVSVVTYSRHFDGLLVGDIAGKFKHVNGDVQDLLGLVHAIKDNKVDRVIHMSTVLPEVLESSPYSIYRVNIEGTMNVLEAGRLLDIKRVVFTSSKAAYAVAHGEYAPPTCKPADEEFPRAPRNAYGATKLFGENMSLHYNRVYGLDVAVTRFSSTYGPGKQVRHGKRAIVSKIIESAMLRKPLKVPSGGDAQVDLIYARDIAQGVVLACFAENLKHRIFNIATGKGETFRHLAAILNKAVKGASIEIGPGYGVAGRDSNDMLLDIKRAREELGFNPRFDLEAGTKDYIETMQRLGIKPVADED